MNKYKINKNKPSLTEAQINKHKDFDKLFNNYKDVYSYQKATKPLYKNAKFRMFVVLLLAVLLAYFYGEKNLDKEENTTPKEEQVLKNQTIFEN